MAFRVVMRSGRLRRMAATPYKHAQARFQTGTPPPAFRAIMFIQTESTPNPATLKFLPGRIVMADGTADFADAETAAASPLASALFALDDVARVFFGHDFITVTKAKGEWAHLKAPVLGVIMEHFTRNLPVMGNAAAKPTSTESDSAIVREIIELIDTRVRPAVAQDGGDIVFDSFDEGSGTVFLHLQGACAGCPSSRMTLKNGIENMLKHYIPEVNAVEAV